MDYELLSCIIVATKPHIEPFFFVVFIWRVFRQNYNTRVAR